MEPFEGFVCVCNLLKFQPFHILSFADPHGYEGAMPLSKNPHLSLESICPEISAMIKEAQKFC